MKICTQEKEFSSAIYSYIPDGLPDNSGEWGKMEVFIRNANRWIESEFIGSKMYSEFDSLDEKTKNDLTSLVALKAFREAIPYLNLTLDSNGFGIINTDMVAPASKERVDDLKKQVELSCSDIQDHLIICFLKNAELLPLFSQSESFFPLTDNLFITGQDLRRFLGLSDATRKDLEFNKSEITLAELEVQKRISADYFFELINKRRENNLADEDNYLFSNFKVMVGLYIKGNISGFHKIGDQVVNYMEAHPDKYVTYINSEEFELKNMKNYESKKEDKTYFFGGL